MNLFSHKRDLGEIIGELQVGAQKEREEQQEQYNKIREKELERDLKEQREYESLIKKTSIHLEQEKEKAYNAKVKQLTLDAKKEIEKKVAQENHYKTAEEKVEDDCYRSLIKGINFEE
ncbi:hypothetical protein [Streptococcus sp. oral taxon 431]|uniref:hypothetical protein n=1 Tax=Streptococcus sp. oral taxon 431 TaxID=712633 RepID=UPI0020019DB9|nr:hypothetical protein [Streptococcus sp. oral taxon 431]